MHVTPHLSLPTTVLSRKMTTQNIVVRKLESATGWYFIGWDYVLSSYSVRRADRAHDFHHDYRYEER
jgi:hypothetical protein